MDFEGELIPGVLIKRYKRFFVDIKLKNKIITAHCPNPGSMIKLLDKGNPGWITKSKNQERKLKYTLQIIQVDNIKVCVNTHITNKIVQESINKGLINELKNFEIIQPEKKFGKDTRFDFLLHNSRTDKKAFLEVKSVSLQRKNKHAEFPDSVTLRGAKHLSLLARLKIKGFRTIQIYLVQRSGTNYFKIAKDIDKAYFHSFQNAKKSGVEVLVLQSSISKKGIELSKKRPIIL